MRNLISLRTLLLALAVLIAAACGAKDDEQSAPGGAPKEAPATESEMAHRKPGSSRCARCHTDEDRERSNWRETAKKIGHDIDPDLDSRVSCTCCHLGEVKGFGDPTDQRCLTCHDKIKVTIPKMGSQHCLACHKVGKHDASEIREGAWECRKCHADRQGQEPAIDVHGNEDCANCHRPHTEPWAEPRECTDCHQSEVAHHGNKPTGPGTCLDCHKPHEKANEADGRCRDCHSKEKPLVPASATFAGGHDKCVGCHAPHDFEKKSAMACQSCHKDLSVLGAGKSTKGLLAAPGGRDHNDCASCHTPHDVKGKLVATAPKDSCANCHSKLEQHHPKVEDKGCTGCHSIHSTKANPPPEAQPCSSCHKAASSDTAFHATSAAAVTAKLDCRSCHAPHANKPTGRALCVGCHAKNTNKGHMECTGCHTPHTPKQAIPECGSCHANEKATAPKGHSTCTGCHDAHDGKRSPAAQCATCHADRKTGNHKAVQGGCQTCHRAHGPSGVEKPPDCATCHQSSKLPALHSKHQECSNCHTSHGPTKSDRATCIGCHSDKKDHNPDAATCTGCHVFRK